MPEDLIAYVSEELETDWIGFAEFPAIIRETTGTADDLLRRAGEAAAGLVRDGVLVAGVVTERGFAPWAGGAEESARRIERATAEMLDNGVLPGVGDVCWFDLPSHAAQWAEPVR
ncbi:hypothetical protein [Saccharothrix algeriensis]|uniref:Uncharacterized protein n=1 Tax=Saccharothrix algeriensis TaxID=173560 RepID=A0A8T8I3M8_9PSEU|nr:hypothetical protein [Saccharothrix algeriensis]MBM7811556.1 hypothetical protein [Saccharothrix algeriensis]QTR05366.1 hypothetical protein J7S33_12470 [Saccharothrix algeriensis]